MKVKKYRLIAISIFTMLFFVWIVIICFFDFPIKTNNIEAMAVLILSLSMTYIVRNRKDLMISMLCIAYTNYSIVVGCYFDTKIRPSWLYNQFQDDRIYGICITSLLIFELTLFFGWYLFECDRNTITSNIDSFPKNNLIMLWCALVYCVIFLTQVRFYENERASSNPLNEYKTIFLIVGSLYSENTNRNRIIWTVLVGASSVATFLGGNRVNTLCNLFVLAVLWYEKQITFKRVVCISIPAIFIMLMIGEMRNNFILSIEAIKSVWESVKQDKLVADSFTFAYGPTIAATELGFGLPIGEKIELLAKNIIYIFCGGTYGKYNLADYTRSYYLHYYGFIGPDYFNIWFGVFGGFISGISVLLFLFFTGNKNNNSTNKIREIIALTSMATTLRWYNYNFMQLYRTALIVLIVWYVARIADSLSKRKRHYAL